MVAPSLVRCPLPLPRRGLARLEGFDAWARQEFGHARLGHARRTERAVALAARLCQRPAAQLTRVCAGRPAEQQAAYEFLDNDAVSAGALRESIARATARRAGGAPSVFVPVDATSLNLAQTDEHNDFGPVGPRSKPGRGVHLMNAIAIAADGVPLGLCAQVAWVRTKPPSRSHKQRTTAAKETKYWTEALAQAVYAFAEEAPGLRPWFQLDRGGDAWPVLLEAHERAPEAYLTVRAAQDRRLWQDADGAEEEGEGGGKLWAALGAEPPWLAYELEVEGAPGRRARTARLELRARPVTVRAFDKVRRKAEPIALWAVLVRELAASAPAGERPLEWMLLTTYPVESAEDACRVVFGYAQRWRVEQFHRALKTGGTDAEAIALRTTARVERWVALHSAVAMRLVRLSYLGRQRPEVPASEELSEAEERAVCVSVGWRRPGRGLSVGQAVVALAALGGYVGKSSGGPPGFEVLGRGLQTIATLARALEAGTVGESPPNPPNPGPRREES
jgi:hypothetical protein